ncbi:MAG: threonine-phosphate decarboxylase CobD [Anaerovoracaceae bacterium]
MKKLVHGGDIYTEERIIDYSANINPLGLPRGVKKAVAESLDLCIHYPDPLCRELTAAVAEKDDVAPEHLLFGNGAADVIFRLVLAKAPKKALLTAPTFSEYESALDVVGCFMDHYLLREEEGFALDRGFLSAIHKDLDILFLCNPNNPTGLPIDRQLLLEILARCAENHVLMVVDECFLAMTEEISLKDQVEEYPNLFILRAFTKDYAMPGLRLGYGISSDLELLERMFSVGQPWSVSVPAQKAGVQATREEEYRKASRVLVDRERDYLVKELKALGYKVYPPAANYIFFRVDRHKEAFHREMRQAGFLVRDCSNYRGLEEGYFRIAVRKREDNEKLVTALREREEKWQKR